MPEDLFYMVHWEEMLTIGYIKDGAALTQKMVVQ